MCTLEVLEMLRFALHYPVVCSRQNWFVGHRNMFWR